jgi:hypothetical protein
MKPLATLTLALATLATPAWCADQIKATIHLGTKAGIFAKHNIEVEPTYTSGSGEIKGLDTLMPEAVSLKFIPEPLTQAQLAELIQIQGKK